jgi:hypothetical protein
MPYKVILTLVGGERTQQPDIYRQPTPNIGDKITVNIENGATLAEVTSVRKYPSRSPGTAVEAVDDVDAQEQ